MNEKLKKEMFDDEGGFKPIGDSMGDNPVYSLRKAAYHEASGSRDLKDSMPGLMIPIAWPFIAFQAAMQYMTSRDVEKIKRELAKCIPEADLDKAIAIERQRAEETVRNRVPQVWESYY
ncbi:hypothetical protein KY311_03550 [Candidatus Woesearchaeota archaeon]|nr:hypothetical protein [Candidatus Woesearchaeota archaeon]